MNPSDLDHDSRRELEQHALRNVRWLAAKLGYQDALDRRQERWLVIAIGAALAVIVVALSVSAMHKDSADRGALELQRCLVDARVQVTDDLRAQVAKEHPELTPAQRQPLVENIVSRAAATLCAKAATAQ